MPDHPTRTYKANDRIPLGDLIKAYILHHLVPTDNRNSFWHQNEQLMHTTLNHISELVHDLPGQITVTRKPTSYKARSNQ